MPPPVDCLCPFLGAVMPGPAAPSAIEVPGGAPAAKISIVPIMGGCLGHRCALYVAPEGPEGSPLCGLTVLVDAALDQLDPTHDDDGGDGEEPPEEPDEGRPVVTQGDPARAAETG